MLFSRQSKRPGCRKTYKKIKVDKASGEDKIPPRLLKMASNFLSEPITNIINTAIDTNTFPDRAKQASVTPIDKGGNDKHIYTNYRPVSVLNTFSKIIELAIFDQLTKHANNFLSIFVSTYPKMYGTQYVIIRLVEEWQEQIDHNKIVGTVLLDLSKAFDCIPHDLLTIECLWFRQEHSTENNLIGLKPVTAHF